jgi:hypothetical protein
MHGQVLPIEITGAELSRELKGASPEVRAEVSANISAGRLIVTPLSVRWANRMCGANERHAKAARTNKQKSSRDDKLDQLLAELGIDSVFASIDRLTAPVSD